MTNVRTKAMHCGGEIFCKPVCCRILTNICTRKRVFMFPEYRFRFGRTSPLAGHQTTARANLTTAVCKSRDQITLSGSPTLTADLDTSEFLMFRRFLAPDHRTFLALRTTLGTGMPRMHSFSHDFPLHALNQNLSRSKQDRVPCS